MFPFLAPGFLAQQPALVIANLFGAVPYTGTGASQVVTTGFQPDMVWLKKRSASDSNYLFDSSRGGANYLITNSLVIEATLANAIAFGATSFTIGDATFNANTATYASWSFRRAPKFFDVQIYTGDGTTGRIIPHSLGQAPGLIVIKKRNVASTDWKVYHRSLGTGGDGRMALSDTTAVFAPDGGGIWGNSSVFTAPTSTGFTISSNAAVNTLNDTYVAYLFGHDTATTGLIQCGSFTTDGAGNGTVSGLPGQPQFVILKRTDAVGDWYTLDTARGWTAGTDKYVRPNDPAGENTALDLGAPTSDGFTFANISASSTYIYMAIRS